MQTDLNPAKDHRYRQDCSRRVDSGQREVIQPSKSTHEQQSLQENEPK